MTNSTRLTALDGTFLELEDADPSAHMHIGAILVFDARPDGTIPSLDELRDYLSARLDLLPRYQQRLAGDSAGVMTWQRWVRDRDFDITRHVRHAELAIDARWDELLEWSGTYFSARLNRSRPLWEVMLITGLADGHWALVTKTHHCMVDGVGSVQAAHLLLDGVAGALSVPELQGEDAGHAFPDWLSPGGILHDLKSGLHAVTHPQDLARRATALAETLVREEVWGAPDTSLNGPIGIGRVLRGVDVDLDEARAIKRQLGGTLNDLVLAGVCAGLRRVLIERGEELPERGLRAMVPMNVRQDTEGSDLGNRINSLFVDLPVAEPDPVRRHTLIRAETSWVKTSSQPLGNDSLLRLTGLAPPVLHHLLARTLFAKRLFNVTVTNVPGPPTELTALGAPLKAVWPLVPIAADHAVGIAIISYNGRLCFGINADRETVPDVDVIAEGIAAGLTELRQAAGHPEPVATPAG